MVFAPVLEVDQHGVQRGAVLALQVAVFAQRPGGLKHVGADNIVAQTGELGVCEPDLIQAWNLARKFCSSGLVVDIFAAGIFQLVDELVDQLLLDLAFLPTHPMVSHVAVLADGGIKLGSHLAPQDASRSAYLVRKRANTCSASMSHAVPLSSASARRLASAAWRAPKLAMARDRDQRSPAF